MVPRSGHTWSPLGSPLCWQGGGARPRGSQLCSHGARGRGDGAWRGWGGQQRPALRWDYIPSPHSGRAGSGAQRCRGGRAGSVLLRQQMGQWGGQGAGGSCAAVPSACCQLSRCCGCLILSGGTVSAGWGLEGLWGDMAGRGGQGSLLGPVWGRGCQGGGCCSSAEEPVRDGDTTDMPGDTRRGKSCGSHRQRSCAWGQAGENSPGPCSARGLCDPLFEPTLLVG